MISDKVPNPVGVIPSLPASAVQVELKSLSGPQSGATIHLSRVITLMGSRRGCKLVLNHRHVSPVHAAIIHHGLEVQVVDLASKNGSKVNDLPLHLETLSQGDRLGIGPWQFEVSIRESSEPDRADVHAMDLEPAPQLMVLEHVDTKRVLQLHRDVCVIGRRQGSDIVIEAHTVSRTHALLFHYHGFPTIVDLLSQNGTYINARQVTFQILRNGDLLTIGETPFRVHQHISGAVGKAVQDVTPTTLSQPRSSNDSSIDLVDIAAVESSQTWAIADKLEKVNSKR